MTAPRFLLASDVGGTFTDTVLLDAATGRLWSSKVPSRNRRQEESVAEGVRDVLRGLAEAAQRGEVPGIGRPGDVGPLVMHHGTTVATNALLERRGATTVFLTNEGFEDLLDIRRQDRPDLYDPRVVRPEPLVPRERRVGLPVRRGPAGEDWSMPGADLEEVLGQTWNRLVSSGATAVAVGLLHADLHPADEAHVAAWLRARDPELFVCASHEVWPEMREVERFETTVLNAYLGPLVGPYVTRLAAALRIVCANTGGLDALRVIDSAGTLAAADASSVLPAGLLLSGPAGGVAAAAGLAGALGLRRVVTFDVGGTSTDVAFILDGSPSLVTESRVGGFACRFPAVAVHTLGAGGGSIVWRDVGGHVQVGPQSQGAYPGPACYGRGGEEPTLTDALLLMGRIPQGIVFGGRTRPERAAAFRVFERLAARLGRPLAEVVRGAVRLAVEATAGGVHVVTTRQGHDARGAALVAFGGAGPLLAAELATAMGMTEVVVPWDAGTFSARGIVSAPVVARRAMGLDVRLQDRGAGERPLEAPWVEAAATLPGGAARGRAALRYDGQSHELEVPVAPELTVAEIEERFRAAHAQTFGHVHARPVEIVRLVVEHVTEHADPGWSVDPAVASTARPAGLAEETVLWVADAEERPAPVLWRADIAAGQAVPGPVVVPDATSITYVPPGWSLRVDPATRALFVRWEERA